MDCFFEKDDLLNRKKHAEFLKTMITHCDRFRREDSSKSFVIAINSEWGTGKTRFVKMLRNYLEERTVDDIAKRKNKTESRFRVVYYNSWEYDFWDDALEPLIYTILNSPEFKPYRFDEKGKKLIKELREYSIGIIKATAYALAHYVIGDAATEEVRTTIKEVIENNQDPLCDFKVRVDLYVNFTKKLQELVSYSKKKLVIIIDELDRCKPTFAIKTLEIAKHLFNVDGLTFIFSLDINQLSSSVRTVYGSDIDSSGYLCRFFDYIGKLPAADLTNFLEKQLECVSKRIFKRNVEYIYRGARNGNCNSTI